MSTPPFDHGLHFNIRFIPRALPIITPYSSILCKKYVEQLGVNLQTPGKSGEIQNL